MNTSRFLPRIRIPIPNQTNEATNPIPKLRYASPHLVKSVPVPKGTSIPNSHAKNASPKTAIKISKLITAIMIIIVPSTLLNDTSIHYP